MDRAGLDEGGCGEAVGPDPVTITLSITETQIITAVRLALVAFLGPDVPVIRGQTNRVASPKAVNYVVIMPTDRRRLATNHTRRQTPLTIGGKDWTQTVYTEPTQIDLALDVHGVNGGDIGQIITTLFRSGVPDETFPPGMSALFCDDALQVPFINGEMQYEDRWNIRLALQVNPELAISQDFADALDLVLIEADMVAPAPPTSDWAIATGFWNDGGYWRDTAVWLDQPA